MVVLFCGKRILSNYNFLKIPKRDKFIILLPELVESRYKGPVYEENKVLEFNSDTVEKCISSIEQNTIYFQEELCNLETKLANNEVTDLFNDVLNPIELMYVPIRTLNCLVHTLSLMNPDLLSKKSVTNIDYRIGSIVMKRFMSKPIYLACKEAMSNEKLELTHQQRRVLYKYVEQGKTYGMELNDKEYDAYLYHTHMLGQYISEYNGKVEASRSIFKHVIDNPNLVRDFPEELLKLTAADPKQYYTGPWTITLAPEIYAAFMEYCPDRKLRFKCWDASVTCASTLQVISYLQASTPLEEIRSRRIDLAKRMGYKNYADMSMSTKMVESTENLFNMFDIMLKAARPVQEQEINELTRFAQEREQQDSIDVWDLRYWRRKHFQTLHKYNKDLVKQYFPYEKVLAGLFDLSELLFSIKIVENEECTKSLPKDVFLYDVFDTKVSSTVPIGRFYLNPYTNKNKERLQRYNAWLSPIRSKSEIAKTTPEVAMILNFNAPSHDKPALLNFEEVGLLFQRFGSALQNLLTTSEYCELSGTTYMEWDAAYISDYFMVNWLYETSTLQQISGHYDTGEPLPAEIITTLQNLRTHLAGYDLCYELYMCHFDVDLYTYPDEFWTHMMKRLWPKYLVFPLHKRNCHICSVSPIFGDRWGASYFSRLWSEMIAADLFSTFQEMPSKTDANKKIIGTKYRDIFLSLSGIYPARENFRKFRGRDPNPEAFLRTIGINSTANEN